MAMDICLTGANQEELTQASSGLLSGTNTAWQSQLHRNLYPMYNAPAITWQVKHSTLPADPQGSIVLSPDLAILTLHCGFRLRRLQSDRSSSDEACS